MIKNSTTLILKRGKVMGISDGLFSKAKIILGVGSVKRTSINDPKKSDIIYVRSLRDHSYITSAHFPTFSNPPTHPTSA